MESDVVSYLCAYNTAEENLDGDNMYLCEKCKAKRKSVKRLSIYKYPQVLVSTSMMFTILYVHTHALVN